MLVCVFGKRGAGKTHLINAAISECVKPVVVIDVLGNFTHLENSGALVTESTSEGLEAIISYKKYQKLSTSERRFTEEPADTIVIQPFDVDDCMNYVCALLWEEWEGTIVLDEVDAVNVSEAKMFMYIVKYGRNRRIHLLTGCRRPAELSRNITAGANAIYVFQTQETRDVEYFEKTILGKEQAQRLYSLDKYHGVFIDYDKKTIGDYKTDQKGDVYILSEAKTS